MRHLKGIPEDLLRETFAYDPASPSGLVRLHHYSEARARCGHIHRYKEETSFKTTIRINRKTYRKNFAFGAAGKSESRARSEAEAWIAAIKIAIPETPRPAGSKNSRGYWQSAISYKGKKVYLRVNRIIFFLCTDIDIEGLQVDHIDNNRSNNNISNLRSGTNVQNSWNKKMLKTNKTGVKGLSNIVKTHSFSGEVSARGKTLVKSFSYGANATDAHKAEVKANATAWLRETRKRLHGAFTNHGDESAGGS